MTRLTLLTMLAASLAGPWGGCERGPVTPPAVPPPERAPSAMGAPAQLPSDDGIVLAPSTRSRG